jgi:transketolase
MNNTRHIIDNARELILALSKKSEAYTARAISTLHIRAVLFNEITNWIKFGPASSQSDLFFDGSPHHASATYSILEQMGFIDWRDLEQNFGTDKYPSVHPGYVMGNGYNAGSLGTSLTKAVSTARILQAQGINKRIYCLEGNSSMQEGSTHEALGFLQDNNVKNLVLLINDNGHGLDGRVTSSFYETLKSYGFMVFGPVDGHNLEAIRSSLHEAKQSAGPIAIIFKTYLMADPSFVLPEKDDKYIGQAIANLASRHNFQVLTADTANSTGLSSMKEVAPDRILDFGCREQLMVDSLEMYSRGNIPVIAGTFVRYLLERAREQVSNLIDFYAEGYSTTPVILLATHNGISHAHNGKSHFYLNGYEFIDHPNVKLHHAVDSVQLEAIIERALQKPELSIILTEREDASPAIFHEYPFTEDEPVPVTDFKSKQYNLIIANGHIIHAAKMAANESPHTEVLSVPHLNSLMESELLPYLKAAKQVIILEESDRPFLGHKIETIALKNKVRVEFKFGYVTDTGFDTYPHLLARNKLDFAGIKALLNK